MPSTQVDWDTSLANTGTTATSRSPLDDTSSHGQTADDIPVLRKPQGRPSSTKWTELKPVIHRLYMIEDKTLKEVTEIMKTEYAFAPTERSFKRWIAAWGWRKNIQVDQSQDDGAVHAALQSRHQTPNRGANAQTGHVRLANGQIVDVARLAEYVRRKRARMSGAAYQQGVHLEKEYMASNMPMGIVQPDDLRVCEAICSQTRSYTQGRYYNTATNLRTGALLLLRYSYGAVRWLNFVGGVKDALKQGLNDKLALRMRSAPDELASMIRLQPYSIMCSLYMFILQTSAHMSSEMSHDEMAQLRAVVKSLMRYGATVAQSMGLPAGHPLPKLLWNLSIVPDNDLGELMFRVWGSTWQWWGTVSLEGILDSEIAIKCARNFLALGEKGDIMTYTLDVLDECRKKCEIQYGLNDDRTIRTLQARAELNTVIVTENGLDCYNHPEVVDLYEKILDRAKEPGPARALALRFFKERSEAVGEEWKKDVADLVKTRGSVVPHSVAQLYMHVLAGSEGTRLPP